MGRFLHYGGYYGGDRNEPMDIAAKNPKAKPAEHLETGNAGADGYTVLSRANRYDGSRPPVEGYPEPLGPDMEYD